MGISGHFFLLNCGNDIVDGLFKDLIDSIHFASDISVVDPCKQHIAHDVVGEVYSVHSIALTHNTSFILAGFRLPANSRSKLTERLVPKLFHFQWL